MDRWPSFLVTVTDPTFSMKLKNYIFILTFFVCVGCSRPPAGDTAHKERGQKSDSAAVILNSTINQTVVLPSIVPDQNKVAAPSFKPFIVYQDKGSLNRFVPSGYMPTGECLLQDDHFTEKCAEGKTCIKAQYDVECSRKSRKWAGVYWLSPADNWGDHRGGFNLNGATRLIFWAKGEKGGERIEEFKFGGVGFGREYPDSDTAMIGPVILSNEWREYTIDLRGKNLTYISGGFAWVANSDNNSEVCIFYLDHIHYE